MPTVRVPHVLHKDTFVNQRVVTYRQVHTSSNRPESRGSATCSVLFDAGPNDAKGTENCGSSRKEKLTSQLCRGNRTCVGSLLRSESADEDGLNIQTAENREGFSIASH